MLLHSSAYRGSFLLSSCASSGRLPSFAFALAGASSKTLGALRPLTTMSYRGGPNSHRGRGRGGGGGGRGGRGGGGGRGEQRWWDPQWRAERLRQIHGEVEKVDENEWWNKISQLREGLQQELVVKQNFGRDGQNILANMAQRQGLYFKAPLPDYRADLDERHGSTQKEIKMSNQTERRVEDLLSRAKSNTNDSASASTSTVSIRQPLPGTISSIVEAADYIDKEKLSSQLRDLQNSRKMTASARSMQSFREKLPAFNMREGFLKAVAANQVLVISGETGCGKTTQLPQFVLEEEINNLRGADCSIICTQPRRISAISVAARVASERGEELGETVGYQIRLESKRSTQTRLLFCTTGVLLRRLGFTFPVTEFFLEDILEKTGYKIKPERDQFPGSSRRKKVSSVKVDPLSEVFEDVDINKEYGNYSVTTRQSLEAWSATELDLSLAKETSYDALNKLACLLPSWISKASAHQLPEIIRTPLQELCLTIKSLQLGAVASFLSKALQPPDPLSVKNAVGLLKTIGALDDMEELTSLGRHLCTLPLDPNIGKMLLMGSVFQCLDPVLTIAAALAYRNPFVLPIDRKEEADAVKRSFAGDSCSDHIALLKAFVAWKEAKRSGRERSFCWENFLSPMTLKMMDDMRNQFFDLLSDIGFVNKSRGVKCKRRGKRTAFYTKDVGKVDIHPSSVNAFVNQFPLPYLVYSEKVKTASIYVRDSTNISEYALLLFGGSLSPSKTGEGIEMLGGYLHFSAPKRILELIQRLRGELDKLLHRKIEDPAVDIFSEGKGVVAAAVELLHSQDVYH
ncbi:hypothetical protein PR202_ga00485 [Eleusine coracana subsp. coracana]|uniref:ATP-dependent RNA helicase DHX36 n=1 Tax=Eleusine coracana subsp. coracana TaxID=191504 RepID=A0AAV5BD61_ELECO|nr:hypothetical protein PR202_ga00485 [Eleusine coracana subsp. coracana]